jgi:aldehyde reductase
MYTIVQLSRACPGAIILPRSAARAWENYNIRALPQDAFTEINAIQTRQRLNEVVKTGVPGFIARGG